MKVIDVLVGIAKDMIPPDFKFRIDHSYVVYFVENGTLYYQNNNDNEKDEVGWSMYKDWLNRDIQIVGEE